MSTTEPIVELFVFKKWANTGLFCCLFSAFSKKHNSFTTNQCEKMSIQYMAPGFEPTNSRT